MELYGRQRMWGTVGWGIFSLVVGSLNYAFSASDSVTNYRNYILHVGCILHPGCVCDFRIAAAACKINHECFQGRWMALAKATKLIFHLAGAAPALLNLLLYH
ncbi:hypothetical protein AVEN_231260-1 [Araneus ventricosus]|uniref:Uncharacterized protein n=1 Tax=Araneus ventricosus TaxID=182803 RepID=A0A4Y2CIL1_ARAVE|nr:hypothetical protein AVEN_231260-1 [Araneus ventricosus]